VEFCSEPVEQFRVGRKLPELSEIAWGSNKALPKMLQPDAVNEHSGGERIAAVNDGVSELRAAASGGERNIVGFKNSQHSAGATGPGFAGCREWPAACRQPPDSAST
jgi:hypothetical protein